MSALKIIVEGSNLSGKSSIVDELEKRFVHSVVVTFHGYYHPRFLEAAATTEQARQYHQRRISSVMPFIAAVSAEELIFNRLHITASVYLKLFYNFEENFYNFEERLNDLSVHLILTDFNNEALDKRLTERLTLNKQSPWGDDRFSKIKEKRDLYRCFFNASKIRNKLLIDNSNMTAQEAADEIEKQLRPTTQF